MHRFFSTFAPINDIWTVMRKYVFILLLAFLMAACGERRGSGAERTPDVDTIPMMVMQIQKCSRLYTSEYQIHKIVTFSDTMSVAVSLCTKVLRLACPWANAA
jgi:hypothetical protein